MERGSKKVVGRLGGGWWRVVNVLLVSQVTAETRLVADRDVLA